MLRFKFTFLLTFDIPPLSPRSQQFSFGEICSQKDCEKLEKMRSQDAEKKLYFHHLAVELTGRRPSVRPRTGRRKLSRTADE